MPTETQIVRCRPQYDTICDLKTYQDGIHPKWGDKLTELYKEPKIVTVPVYTWDEIKDRLKGFATLLSGFGSMRYDFDAEVFSKKNYWIRPKDIFYEWRNYQSGHDDTFYDFTKRQAPFFEQEIGGNDFLLIVY